MSNTNNNNNSTTQQDIDFLLVDDYGGLLLPPANASANPQSQRSLGLYQQAHTTQSFPTNTSMMNNSQQQGTTPDRFTLQSRGPLHAQMGVSNNTTFQVPASQEGQQQNVWNNTGLINLNQQQQQQIAFMQQQQSQQVHQQQSQQVQQQVFFPSGTSDKQSQQQNIFVGAQINAGNTAGTIPPSSNRTGNNNLNLNVTQNFPASITSLNQINGQQFPINTPVALIGNNSNFTATFVNAQNQQPASNINIVKNNIPQSLTSYAQIDPSRAEDNASQKKRPPTGATINRKTKTRIDQNVIAAQSFSNRIGHSNLPSEQAITGLTLPTATNSIQGNVSLTIQAGNMTRNPAQSIVKPNKKLNEKKDPSDKKLSNEQLEKMSPEERRRYDRNLREQQRSMKISQQIKELRALLTESHIPFKPNKYSILMSVVNYVKELQNRAIYLDGEHRKLVNTILKTSEIVNSGRTVDAIDCNPSTVGMESELLFVHDIDYKLLFSQCGAALGVAALDGRFIDCNAEFESVSGLSKSQLKQGSLFNLLTPSDMKKFFNMIGEMLKNDKKTTSNPGEIFWSGVIAQKHGNFEVRSIEVLDYLQILLSFMLTCIFFCQLKLNITLTRKANGVPKFFNCALTST